MHQTEKGMTCFNTYLKLENTKATVKLLVLVQKWGNTTAALQKILLNNYVWIFENGAHVRRATLTVFQKITEDFSFNQPQTACQHTAYSPIFLVSGWLASRH